MQSVAAARSRRLLVSQFAALGSQQTTPTIRPRQTKPPTQLELTLSHLVASGAALGHSLANSHRAARPYIYGTRGGVAIIDLSKTLTALRRAAMLVRATVERDGTVLFVGDGGSTLSTAADIERIVMSNARRLGPNGFGVTKWKPGTISNALEVFKHVQSAGATPATKLKPSLVVLLTPTASRHALAECTQAEIPTIGVCDTNVDPRIVTYPVVANGSSVKALELLAGVLGMAGQEGAERKQERLAADALLSRRRDSR